MKTNRTIIKNPSLQLLNFLRKEKERKRIIMDSIRNGIDLDELERHGIKLATPI